MSSLAAGCRGGELLRESIGTGWDLNLDIPGCGADVSSSSISRVIATCRSSLAVNEVGKTVMEEGLELIEGMSISKPNRRMFAIFQSTV